MGHHSTDSSHGSSAPTSWGSGQEDHAGWEHRRCVDFCQSLNAGQIKRGHICVFVCQWRTPRQQSVPGVRSSPHSQQPSPTFMSSAGVDTHSMSDQGRKGSRKRWVRARPADTALRGTTTACKKHYRHTSCSTSMVCTLVLTVRIPGQGRHNDAHQQASCPASSGVCMSRASGNESRAALYSDAYLFCCGVHRLAGVGIQSGLCL